jgi:hypothetical protein
VADCELHRPDAGFRAQLAFSFGGNGEREVSMPRRYGFEIVHGGTIGEDRCRPVRIKQFAYQSKIYAKSNHSNFRQRPNLRFIRA